MKWSAVWAVWLVVTAVSFGVLEWVTFRKHQTLSENLRRWLGIDPARKGRRVSIVLFTGGVTAFAVWFIPHIVA